MIKFRCRKQVLEIEAIWELPSFFFLLNNQIALSDARAVHLGYLLCDHSSFHLKLKSISFFRTIDIQNLTNTKQVLFLYRGQGVELFALCCAPWVCAVMAWWAMILTHIQRPTTPAHTDWHKHISVGHLAFLINVFCILVGHQLDQSVEPFATCGAIVPSL